MNDTAFGPAELQAAALVEQIGQQVAERRRQLLDAAAREADEIGRRAREKARRQSQRAIDDLRATGRRRLRQLNAEIETARRRQASARALDALALAWPRLADALVRRWRDAAARERWVTAQIALARQRLPAAGWVVRHPASASAADLAALHGALQAAGAADAALRADAQLAAGLVIEVDGARLDSSPPALLADRALVEAALLAALSSGASPP